ncbi:MAG: cytochrome c3 family protein [Lewinellaceae bacterium]|nr:cytochrome c3 family protein [Lewinellaceae bacterium]
MKINCAACHTSAGWEIEAKFWQEIDPEKPQVSKITGWENGLDTLRFHHNKTDFKLEGRHAIVDCRACHSSLVFSEANSDCISCHADIHQQTAGTDCARCHTSSNWLVDNITALHQENGFPLTGVHKSVSCEECHVTASTLQFNRIGNDCASCHLTDFNATTNPNHKQAGFSTDCLECHDPLKPGWGTEKVNHDFFPLTKGHEISDCAKCHVGGDFSSTPTNCFACHQPDFEGATNPNHVQANFPNDCAVCHTTDPDWMPAQYTQHDVEFFPIYSGKHKGQWSLCADCHTNPSNFAEFSCTTCHINPETDDGHNGVNGYVYENSACLSCHPTGDADNAFDHNTTNFPLTGAHLSADCLDCHAGGYAGTPTQCSACHTTDFNGTTNPNHVALNIPTDCAMCHTTAPGWEPATFPIHNDYYALNGAHAVIANDCATCHAGGNYNNTPNTCNGCHAADYNATTDPNHVTAQFPTDCATCHSETAWAPSTFDHNTIYPFTGAHIPIANDCDACHHGNYTNTPNTCAGCHTIDFNGTTNPNHVALGLPTDCAMCHTTAPDWEPASFPIHDNYYVLNGAHIAIANDCATCHSGKLQ